MSKKLVSLFLCLLMLCACLPAVAEDGITVTDMMGREVTLAGPAERIVVVMPSDCEILYAIGAGPAVVGRGTYCNYPEEAAAVPEIQSGGEFNVEQVIGMEPDVVIMTKMAHDPAVVEQLEQNNIPVIVTDAQTLEDTYDCIALLGTVTGKTAEAEAVAADMKARIDAVAAKVEASGKTVYFETTPLEYGYGLWSAAKGNFMDEIGTICGLTNIFNDLEEAWPMVNEEDVIQKNPDYIITIDSSGMGDLDAAAVITARESWQGITAVKDGNVLIVGNDAFTRPGPRLADAVETLYGLIYGEAEEVPAA